MLSALDVANYFLTLASHEEEEGELISNLKLQKLVYYAQGFCLAITGKPAFPEPIEAWMHGPVIPDLYHAFKEYGVAPIPPPDEFNFEKYPEEIRAVLDDVYDVYGKYSAVGLRALTHQDPPWKDTSRGCTIPLAKMKEYFATQICDG